MAESVIEAVGSGKVEYVDWSPLDKMVETGDFRCDMSRFQSETGWEPQLSLGDGLRYTVGIYHREFSSMKISAVPLSDALVP